MGMTQGGNTSAPDRPPRISDMTPLPAHSPEMIEMKAACWYNFPEMVNDGVVLAGIWWWTRGGEWARPWWSLLLVAFAVGFALRLYQLVSYNDLLNRLVFNTFGHNIVLWFIVIGEAVYLIDQYKFFGAALFLMGHHLFFSAWIDLPGRFLVNRRNGGDATAAFRERIRAQTPGA